VANQRLRVGGRSGRCSVVGNENCDVSIRRVRELSYSGPDLVHFSKAKNLSFLEEEISWKTCEKDK